MTISSLRTLLPILFLVPVLGGAPAALAADDSRAATAPATAPAWHLELDAYYSNVNIDVPLTDEQVPDLGETGEFDIYRQLLQRSLLPRFVNLELSVYPMPLLGVSLRKEYPDSYDQSTGGDNFNLVESLTAGFREPYAVSLFFGNLADFVKPGESRRGGNRAYSGYLFSVGDHHIRHNRLIDDQWLEIEWKLKGDRNFENEKISWSFRIGSRLHENPEIVDSLYLGLRRSNLDYDSVFLSWLKNSSLAVMTELNAETFAFQRQEIIIGKRFPLKSANLAFALDFGGIWQIEDRIYTGSLGRDNDADDSFILVIRPNLVF